MFWYVEGRVPRICSTVGTKFLIVFGNPNIPDETPSGIAAHPIICPLAKKRDAAPKDLSIDITLGRQVSWKTPENTSEKSGRARARKWDWAL